MHLSDDAKFLSCKRFRDPGTVGPDVYGGGEGGGADTDRGQGVAQNEGGGSVGGTGEGGAAAEDAAPHDAAPHDAAPQDAAPQDAAPQDAAPQDTPDEPLTEPGGATPGGLDAAAAEGNRAGRPESGQHGPLGGLAAAAEAVAACRAGLERVHFLTDAQARAAVAAAYRLIATTTATALALVKELDSRPEAVSGAPAGGVAKTFLVYRLHVDGGAARAFVAAAHALDPQTGDLPMIGAALADGRISYEHASTCVRAVAKLPKKLRTCTVTDVTTGEQVSGMELVDRVLARTIGDQPLRGVRYLTDRLVTLLDPDRRERFDADAHLQRGMSLITDSTGMGLLRVTLTPADTALLTAVLSQLAKPNPATTCTVRNPDGSLQHETVRDERTHSMRGYDALLTLIRTGLQKALGLAPDPEPDAGNTDNTGNTGNTSSSRRSSRSAGTGSSSGSTHAEHAAASNGDGTNTNRDAPGRSGWGARTPEVRLIVTATAEQAAGLRGAGPARLDRVGPIDTTVLGILTCSATLRRVLTDDRNVPIDVGRAYRLAPPALRAALTARDGGCIIPGCPVPADGCDAHHVIPWSRGGPTTLANTVLACPQHHQGIHAEIWTVHFIDDQPWVTPPAWVDPERRPRRNPLHHSGSDLQTLARQLAFALSDEDRADELPGKVAGTRGPDSEGSASDAA